MEAVNIVVGAERGKRNGVREGKGRVAEELNVEERVSTIIDRA